MTDNASTAGPDAVAQMPSRRDVIGFLAMVFGMFMAILDIQIVSASLSEIQAGLGAGSEEVSWVQTSYLIAEVIMIPLSGMLARIVSTRVLFSCAAAGFTIASAMAATATNIEQMIIYRAIQGFIGGGMIPSVFAAAFTIFPPSKRSIVSPIIGLVATLAPTIGPTVGGYISHAMSWHWLFLINIFPGIIVTLVVWTFVDFDKPDRSLLAKFDWWGLFSMALFLGAMEYVLEEGNNKDWFNDERIVWGALLMTLGGVVFFYRAFTCEQPVVDLRAFSNRNFAFGSLFSFVMGMGLYGLTYLYPLYLSRVRGYDSLMIGETMFVSGLAMFLTAPLAGILSTKMDPRLMMACGFTSFALGTYMVTGMTADWDFYDLLLPQILRGCSLMTCMVPINNIALGTLPPERIKNASGLYNLTRNLGGAVGLAIINTLLTRRTDEHYGRLVEHINWSKPAAMSWIDTVSANYAFYGLDGENAAFKKLSSMINQQAWIMAFMDVFLGITILFIALTALSTMIKKPEGAVPADAAH
ncbi:DHA2 family efflux MFS transporter permease subunit [Agrobacterium vitis]|uniref:MFS permease n=2 Tax=Rhizobium/Agrobacterium group TaxID=227290 RepID=B9JSR9_ALLAM|nr:MULTISPECIES: DHA2 family efflux MFS transporter permease subunit [Rhizobium/Agrobacterium group]ACM37762.1 MFS permease [Allorhizobium ampelinum S4]MCF1433929.1 DHA2 family efflux MFS transporter permease subunit [Allorhizobium ampelinum]MCF1447508.1 DHA2 family efflux MFS transporter permease subunit [Allorhizobium ampelinum]MUO29229.1 DHA2 family efflux MFS transporter permease subunit [Agrobacterium vitis]MUO43681.1 DHA2 family efflux MFS transporter permease subunit [Agrobacterium viti